MEDDLVDFGPVPDNNVPAGENNNQNNNIGQGIPTGEAIGYFAKGLLAGSVAFVVAFLVLSIPSFGVNYIVKSVVSAIFAFMLIKAYDKASGEVPTPMSSAVVYSVIILCSLTLMWGYNNHKEVKEDAKQNTEQVITPSESLTLSSPNDFAITKRKFHYGDNLRVKISGSAVKLNSTTLNPGGGEYNIPVLGNDFVVFNGTSSVPAKIEIYY